MIQHPNPHQRWRRNVMGRGTIFIALWVGATPSPWAAPAPSTTTAPTPTVPPRRPPPPPPARKRLVPAPAPVKAPPPPRRRATPQPAKRRTEPPRPARPAPPPRAPPPNTTVIIGGLKPDPVHRSHRSVSVLDRRAILRLAPRSTPALLEGVPGVVVQRSNYGGGSPFVRGFTGQQVLQLIDGIRLNNSTTRFGPSQMLNTVDPFVLRRVEVLRGPGAVLYGSDAMGGALNLHTRQAPYIPGARFRWGGQALARFGTADMSHLYNVGAWTQVRRVAAALGGSFKVFNTLRGGRDIGEQLGTGYREGAWDGSVRVSLAPGWFLKLATNSTRQIDVPRTDKYGPTEFRIYKKQYRDLAYLALTGRKGRALDSLSVILSYQSHRELRHRYRLAKDRIQIERDDLHVFGLVVTGRTDLGRWSHLVWGADLYADWLGSWGKHEAISTGVVTPMGAPGIRGRFVDDSRMLQGGLFVYDQVSLARWFELHGGVRLAFSQVDIPADPLAAIYGFDAAPIDARFVGPAGGLTMTFIPTPRLRLTTGFQMGFRAPNLDDYSHVGSEGVAFDIPSPDLRRAEKSYTLEAGVRWHGKVLQAWVSGHYSWLTDFIGRQYVGFDVDGEPAAVRANAASGWVAGLEAHAAVLLPRGFSLRGWISWTRGNLELLSAASGRLEKHPMRRVSPLQGQVAVRWSRGGAWFQAAVRWSARQDRLSPGDRNDARICPDGPERCAGTPGFAVVHLAGGARIARHVDVVLRIENVGNEPYKWHGSGVYNPGLSAVTELRLFY